MRFLWRDLVVAQIFSEIGTPDHPLRHGILGRVGEPLGVPQSDEDGCYDDLKEQVLDTLENNEDNFNEKKDDYKLGFKPFHDGTPRTTALISGFI